MNPDAPPPVVDVPVAPGRTTTAELFSLRQVIWASCLASPTAGAVLIAVNARRLGRGRRGIWPLLIVLTILAVGLPIEAVPAFALLVAGCFSNYVAARWMFGRELQTYEADGGKEPNPRAMVGWSLVGLVGSLALAFAVVAVVTFFEVYARRSGV